MICICYTYDGDDMKTNWDLTHLFKNVALAEKAEKELNKKIETFLNEYKRCLDNIDDFTQILNLNLEINELLERVYCYYKRHIDINSQDSFMKEKFNGALEILEKVDRCNQTYYGILYENEDLARKFIENENLEFYNLYFERIFDKKQYVLNLKQQDDISSLNKIVRGIPGVYRHIIEDDIQYEMLQDEDGTEKKCKNTFASQNREIRKQSYLKSRKSRKQFNYTLGFLFNLHAKSVISKARIEGYNNPLEKVLIHDELPLDFVTKVHDNVLKYVDVNHKYIKLIKDELGYEDFYAYDLSCPTVEYKKEYCLNEAVAILKNVLSVFGEEYTKIIDQVFNEGWCDIYSKTGKRTDSVSMIAYSGVPYLLVNYKDDFNSLRCLCHELGHTIHSALAKQKQKFVYFEYNLFVAEISSLVNEELLYSYLIEKAESEEEKLYYLRQRVFFHRNSLFGQMNYSLFEKEVYDEILNGKDLDATEINNIYLKYEKMLFGEEIILTEDDSYDWQNVTQFFVNEPFYMWKYTVARSIAMHVHKLLKEDKMFVSEYMSFLKSGNSMKTTDLLKVLRINLDEMNFMTNAYNQLKQEIEEIKEITKRVK